MKKYMVGPAGVVLMTNAGAGNRLQSPPIVANQMPPSNELLVDDERVTLLAWGRSRHRALRKGTQEQRSVQGI